MEEQSSIFPPEAVTDVQTIVMLRIYDVVMSQLMLDHPKQGQQLLDLHNEGGLILHPDVRFDEEKIEEKR